MALFLLLLSLGVQAVTNVYLSPTGDDLALGDVGAPVQSFSRALQISGSSTAQDVIFQLAPGTYMATSSLTVPAYRSFTVNGSSSTTTIIDVSNVVTLFTMGGVSQLMGVTIQNSPVAFNLAERTPRGIIYTSGFAMKVVDCVFQNNTLPAIYSDSSLHFNMSKCINSDMCLFINNDAYTPTATISLFHSQFLSSSIPVIVNDVGVVAVDHCLFSGNKMKLNGKGTGLSIQNVGQLTITFSTFLNNWAWNVAGHLSFYGLPPNDDGSLVSVSEITNTDFLGGLVSMNQALGAGAVLLYNVASFFTSCNFKDNLALVGSGGALFGNSANISLSNCTFYNNSIPTMDFGGYGGGIYLSSTEMHVQDCTFENNMVGVEGGAICSDTQSPVMTITNSKFIGNSAGTVGNAISTYMGQAAEVYLTGCDFTSNFGGMHTLNFNENILVYVTDCTFNDGQQLSVQYKLPTATGIIVGDVNIANSQFYSSSIYIAYVTQTGVGVTLQNLLIQDANTTGVQITNFQPFTLHVAVENVTITGGLAGAVMIEGATGNITSSKFIGNTNTAQPPLSGGVDISKSDIQFTGCTFTDNIGTQGGAIRFSSATGKIRDSEFSGNKAINNPILPASFTARELAQWKYSVRENLGGAVFGSQATVNIYSSNFSTNAAALGGAIAAQGTILVVRDSNFDGNTANVTLDPSYLYNTAGLCDRRIGYGGALFAELETMRVVRSTFTRNSAISGGAFYLHSVTTTVLNDSFIANIAQSGAVGFLNDAKLSYDQVNMSDNNAVWSGDVFFFQQMNPVSPTATGVGLFGITYAGGIMGSNVDIAANAALMFSNPPYSLRLTTPVANNLIDMLSGNQISPPIVLQVYDYFGNILSNFGPGFASPDDNPYIFATTSSPYPLDLVGGTIRQVSGGLADYSLLSLFAQPGSVVNLTFTLVYPGSPNSPALSLDINVDPCYPGYYQSSSSKCVACPPNTYTGHNNSLSCSTCPDRRTPNANQTGCLCTDTGGLPPCYVNEETALWGKVLIFVLSAISFGVIIVSSILVWKYRTHRVISYASPIFCELILLGTFLVTIGALLGVYPLPAMCTARSWLMPIGFTFAFGAMFARTYRLYKVFNNPKLRVKAIKNSHLLTILMLFVSVDVIIIGIWTATSPYEMKSIEEPYCHSNQSNAFSAVLLALKATLVLGGGTVAYLSRNLPMAYNETFLIAGAIYSVAIAGLLTILVTYAFSLTRTTWTVVQSVLVILMCLGTIAWIFFPKFRKIYIGEDGLSYLEEWKRQIRAAQQPMSSNGNPPSPSKNSGGKPGERDRGEAEDLDPSQGKDSLRAKWEDRLTQVEENIDSLTGEIYKLATLVDQTKKRFDGKKLSLLKLDALRAFIFQELDMLDDNGWSPDNPNDVDLSLPRAPDNEDPVSKSAAAHAPREESGVK